MELLSFDYQIDEFMMYCKSAQLRQKTMNSYEQALRLFERWCADNYDVTTVDQVNESLIMRSVPRLSNGLAKRNGSRECGRVNLTEW